MFKKMGMKTVLSIICFLFCINLVRGNDTIIVHKDPRLEMLSVRQTAINKIMAKMIGNGQFRGYRLQVLNTRNRDEAFDLKSDLLKRFPDQKAYALFQSPYFKVRFGNFIDKEEAEKYKKILSALYPQGIYVVQDIIDYTPKEEDFF